MVFLKWNFGNSHLKLKSGGHVGDPAQKRVDFEVTRPISQEVPESHRRFSRTWLYISVPFVYQHLYFLACLHLNM